jgi:hypothetical protein
MVVVARDDYQSYIKSAIICNQKFDIIYLDNIRQQATPKYIFNEPLTYIKNFIISPVRYYLSIARWTI